MPTEKHATKSRRNIPAAFLLRHSMFFRVIKDFKDFKVLNDPNRRRFPHAAACKGTEYADNYRLYAPKNMFFTKKYRNT